MAHNVYKDRPPVDSILIEFFLDKKCGIKDSHDRLYKWCAVAPVNKLIKAKCQGVSGSSDICDLEAAFLTGPTKPDDLTDYLYDANNTEIPEYPERYPGYIYYNQTCYEGPEKPRSESDILRLTEDLADKIIKSCHQEMYGVGGLPLWLILLVVFLVVLAVSIAGSLFWTYWLKKKLYGKQATTSKMDYRLTSAPFSSDTSKRSQSLSFSRKNLSSHAPSRSSSISKGAHKNSKLAQDSKFGRSNLPTLRSNTDLA